MEVLTDQILFVWEQWWTFFFHQLRIRSIAEWLFFFMPFYIFGEFPRYVLPVFVLLFLKLTGKGKDPVEEKKRFLDRKPSVSVLLVGYNEEASVTRAIDSLLETGYDDIEIIVVDDHSEDRMYEAALPYQQKGLIKLFKNTAASGRSGRPSTSNMALRLSSGDFILSVDADTSFDRDMLLHMIGPFYDPGVGCVAGNLKVRNADASLWARFQAVEYALSIGLWKRWLNIMGMNMQASGAFGAFRRTALTEVGGWDPELAEDADLSMKIKKAGWKIVFAPRAIAMTNAPETRRTLTHQRFRWDMSALRTFYRKHGDILKFWRFEWRNAVELSLEFFFTIFLTLLYMVYLTVMVIWFPMILLFVLLVTYVVYFCTTLVTFAVHLLFSERRAEEWRLIFTLPLFPVYKSYIRWVRFFSILLELFRLNYEDSYLPASAWRNTDKW